MVQTRTKSCVNTGRGWCTGRPTGRTQTKTRHLPLGLYAQVCVETQSVVEYIDLLMSSDATNLVGLNRQSIRQQLSAQDVSLYSYDINCWSGYSFPFDGKFWSGHSCDINCSSTVGQATRSRLMANFGRAARATSTVHQLLARLLVPV